MNKKMKLMLTAAALLIVAGAGLWYFFIRDTAPASVISEEAEQARQDALDEAAEGEEPVSEDQGIDGSWVVDTSIGEFNDACLTEVCSGNFAGFRIDEVLQGIGEKTVVGRTPGVSGTLEISGTSIESAEFLIDMTGLITDDRGRTGQLRSQSIETDVFPEATFVLTAAIDLGELPADGESVTVGATGDLTVHGVTQEVTIPLTAELNRGVIVVIGELGPIQLADYNIEAPRAPAVLSVEDTAILEVQLFFTPA